MRLRSRLGPDEAFDGLTAEEIRRIRGAAEANVTPGLEGLAAISHSESKSSRAGDHETTTQSAKRGRRS